MSECKKECIQYILVIPFVVIIYLCSRILDLRDTKTIVIAVVMVVSILFAGIRYGYLCRYKNLWKNKQEHTKAAVVTILYIGMIMRIGYMLYTPCTVRSHDLWMLDVNSSGHAGYLLNILQRGQLPESNVRQFYQQPFYYICGALFSRVINMVLHTVQGPTGSYDLVDAAKTVSCVASCISLLASRAIFRECGITGKGLIASMALVAFLPAFYLTGGRVGPDALVAMFMILAFLYTFRWLKSPDWKNTIILAAIYGLGMMTKISCGTLAIITACIFLWKFVKEIREKRGRTLFVKFIVFGIISLPAGLWYSIRNYIKFGQPLNYVLKISKKVQLYTGDRSIVQRVIGIDISNWMKTPYADPWSDYNFPVYALKSALFGEFSSTSYHLPVICPAVLLIFATILAIICTVILCYNIKDRIERKQFGKLNQVKTRKASSQLNGSGQDMYTGMALFSCFIFYGSMIWFYIQYPFGCSMDFRYMTFLVVPIGILLGKYMEQNNRNENRYPNWICIICWGYSISSCLMYCLVPVLL